MNEKSAPHPDQVLHPESVETEEKKVATGLLDAIVSNQPDDNRKKCLDGVLIGALAELKDGIPKVMVPGAIDSPVTARSLCALTDDQVGMQCAIMFEGGDPGKPLLMGMLLQPVLAVSSPDTGENLSIEKKDGMLTVNAATEISLHCGKASLRLLQSGRIELRGTTVVSHASGLNRIRGASVKLN